MSSTPPSDSTTDYIPPPAPDPTTPAEPLPVPPDSEPRVPVEEPGDAPQPAGDPQRSEPTRLL